MRRLPTKFYAELHQVRSQFGECEYDRDQTLPSVMDLLRKSSVNEGDLLRDAANAILDNAEKADDSATGLFDFGVDVALGERRRIRRGRMNVEQCRRRKRLIDHNKVAQDQAWAKETDWLNTAMDHLDQRPLTTVVEDVMTPAGEAKKAVA
jgi:hypothetical protein